MAFPRLGGRDKDLLKLNCEKGPCGMSDVKGRFVLKVLGNTVDTGLGGHGSLNHTPFLILEKI
jgi:hypothetical protein